MVNVTFLDRREATCRNFNTFLHPETDFRLQFTLALFSPIPLSALFATLTGRSQWLKTQLL
jgi:hypothetical protein